MLMSALESPVRPGRKLKLAYFASHPIQYQAPMLRRLQQEENLDVTAFFFSDKSVGGYWDPGFGRMVEWDVPLLGGYKHEFLPQLLKEKPNSGIFFRPLNGGIIRVLREQKFDLVWMHGYATLNSLVVMAAAKWFGAKVLLNADSSSLVNQNSQMKEAAKRIYMGLVRSLVDCTFVAGHSNQAYWRRYFGDRMIYQPFPYSVDNAYFRERVARVNVAEVKSRLGIVEGIPVILYASKLQKRKRCMDLVLAYKELLGRTRDREPPYLLIAGDGEERQSLEQVVQESGLARVQFLGFQNQSQLPELFAVCDFFVLPSENEPWGLIVNEVMNAARPVVVTDQVGCQKDLVENGVNGHVYRVGDIAALSEILETLAGDAELRRRMGQASLRIVDEHSYEQGVAGLQAYIRSLQAGSGGK